MYDAHRKQIRIKDLVSLKWFHFKMSRLRDVSLYVARRLLFDHCDIIAVIDDRFEEIYRKLIIWMERFTVLYGARIIPALPTVKESEQELKSDMIRLYSEIMASGNRTLLEPLFTITYFMMIKYSHNPALCSRIPFYFAIIASNVTSWARLNT